MVFVGDNLTVEVSDRPLLELPPSEHTRMAPKRASPDERSLLKELGYVTDGP